MNSGRGAVGSNRRGEKAAADRRENRVVAFHRFGESVGFNRTAGQIVRCGPAEGGDVMTSAHSLRTDLGAGSASRSQKKETHSGR